MTITAITIDSSTIFLAVGMLTVITLTATLLAKSNKFMTKRVETVTAPQMTEVNTRLSAIEDKVAKVDAIEDRQIEFSSKLENGIKGRLDELVLSHAAQDERINGLSSQMSEMLGMLKQHLNYDGTDRRTR